MVEVDKTSNRNRAMDTINAQKEQDTTDTQQMELNDVLSAVLYQFHELQKQLSADVTVFSKYSKDVFQSSGKMEKSVADFSMLAPQIRQQLKETVQSGVTQTLKTAEVALGQLLVASAKTAVEKTTDSLDKSVRDAQKALDNYEENISHIQWMGIFTGAACGFFMVFVFIIFLLIKPMFFMSYDEISTYKNGQIFEIFWPKLSEKERKK